jgi:cellulose synthase (UDP-forming)
MKTYPDRPDAISRLLRVLVLCLTAFLFFQFISIHLSWRNQIILGSVSILLGLVANRLSSSRILTLALMMFSLAATFRYGWWRIATLISYFSNEANQRVNLDAFFLLILISAEAYTAVIMILGYMQTAWPLHRKPIPMPTDASAWPHVDLLIPTYNEPLSLVRYTALAAINIDYPPDKLHVYILDDGSRLDFEEFAREAGVGYLTRSEHRHAKAGNINQALSTMNSPFVAIFDCDHVPTRSFLQMTLGWMLVDQNLAMLQTPHHFYSPDPFERNLLQYKTIPNEAELFYGIIQDGNDFWNATFFCGSCALLRRSALDEVGGIAVETVTEDAHTSLRMQKLGYNTAYINIPQAAGLATETLAAHVGQRVRWARGMIQIMRTDNPLLARGMKFTQRLCYLNAMLHFMYAVPRLVFLGAPLVYLLLRRTIIPGYWVAILAFALPHLVLASLTNSRVQGRHRHSFWNEIYEAVLAPYILLPTLLALINPKLGKFNVTDKGSTLDQTTFDSKIAAPTKWMLLLNFAGLLVAPYRLFVSDPQHTGAVLMNVVWVLFNIVILGVAAAVALEQKQRRESVRINAKIAVRLDFPDGRRIDAMSIDMSVGGASIALPKNELFTMGQSFRMAFPEIVGDAEIGATVVGLSNQSVRVAFLLPTIAEQETLARALYSRADAWLALGEVKEVDQPLVSLGRVIVLSVHGILQVLRSMFPEKSRKKPAKAAQAAAWLLAACLLGACGAASAQAVPAAAPALNLQVLTLRDLGQGNGIGMRGPHSYFTVRFTLAHALVPHQATLKLLYNIDPSLDPHSTSLRVTLNGSAIATLAPPPPSDLKNNMALVEIPVSDALLVRTNTLTFEFTGSGVMLSENQARQNVLCRIFPASSLEVAGDWLRLENDLTQLPLPIFDNELQSQTVVPFVFLQPPTPRDLESAGVVASWFGLLSGSRPVRFAVFVGQIPPGNAVLFSSQRSTLPPDLKLPAGNGSLIALRNHPSDPFGSLLVLAGDDDHQLLNAAQTLALAGKAAPPPVLGVAWSGDTAQLPDTTLPSPRAIDDAPRWLPAAKASPLTNCLTPDALHSDGSSPIPVYFHLPPDLHFGEKQFLDLHLLYRYDAHQLAAGSALRVVLNGVLVNEIPLLPAADFVNGQRHIRIPVEDFRPFGNTLLFSFDFVPVNLGGTQSALLSGDILCGSSIDLERMSLWTRMPNLDLFANAGFPFTRRADLSETTVVLPVAPTTDEIALYLHLMSQFGAETGYPALRVTVAGPSAVISGGRDYLIVGAVADQPAFQSLDALAPATLDANGLHVQPSNGVLDNLLAAKAEASRWWSKLTRTPWAERLPADLHAPPDALVEEIQSPSSPDRSIVMIVLRQSSSADTLAGAFLDQTESGAMTGSVSLFQNSRFASYALDKGAYQMGNISWYALMRMWITRYFLLLMLTLTALIFLAAYWTYGWMAWRAHQRLKLAEPEDRED